MSTNHAKLLRSKLSALRESQEQHQQVRRNQRRENLKAQQELPELPLQASPAVSQFLSLVRAHILQDKQRLFAAQSPSPAGSPPTAETLESLTVGAHGLPPSPEHYGPMLAPLVHSFMATEPLLPQRPQAQAGATNSAVTPAVTLAVNPAVNPAVLAFLQTEYSLLQESNQPRAVTPVALLMKIRQAVQAYAEGRTTDCLTLFKNALNGDPHNQTLLACLSQVLYGLAAGGNATALPEARDTAQRSTIASEKAPPPRLQLYRYLAIVTEWAFSEERAMEWLHESGLLNPLLLQGKEDLRAEQGIYWRAWGVLAGLPPALWRDKELEALQQLAQKVVGGAALYWHWLRPPLLAYAAASKTPLPILNSLETLLHHTVAEYTTIATGLRQLPLRSGQVPWVLKTRWLNTLVKVASVPPLDLILCQIALDTQNWSDNTYPDSDLRSLLEESSLNYWRIWAQSITPAKDVRKNYLFPTEEVLQEAALLAEADTLLGLLIAAETERIKPEIWEDLKPWMIRWQPEHLLATATGSNQPRNRFAPTLPIYSQFYRRWQEPQIQGNLASEIITETAKRGGFASLTEVVAMFEGALRLLDDPMHGLAATQKRAYQAAYKQFPAKFAGRKVTFSKSAGQTGAAALVPLGLLGAMFAAFALSENTSQAIGICLALVGVGGVVMLNLTKE